MPLLVKHSKIRLRPMWISNFLIQDSRISWQSKGVYIYLASLGYDSIHTLGDVVSASNLDGRRATKTAIVPLIDYGYLDLLHVKQYKYRWILHTKPRY